MICNNSNALLSIINGLQRRPVYGVRLSMQRTRMRLLPLTNNAIWVAFGDSSFVLNAKAVRLLKITSTTPYKITRLFLSFPSVCPEPVLAK